MHLEEVFKELKIEDSYFDAIAYGWLRSMRDFPTAIPDFLVLENIRENFPFSALQPEMLPLLEKMAARVSADSALLRLAWHAHRKLTIYENSVFREWPDLDLQLNGQGGMFYLLIECSIISLIRDKYREINIPEQYLVCCERIAGYVATYATGYSKPGINRNQISWPRHYLNATTFRIGRFEYMITDAANYNALVFRHRKTGEVLAVPGPQTRFFNQDGYVLYPDEKNETAAFSGSIIHSDKTLKAIPFDPRGHAIDKIITIDETEWEQVIAPHHKVIGLHIPEGGKMTLDACRESFTAAFEFFHKYFPELNIRSVFCSSWIFYPYYEQILPDSNLAKLMRELYLFPTISSGNDGVYFIFGRHDGDYKDYPRDNSVRCAMLDVLQNGGRLRVGGMFFLEDDIARFGQQAYRNN